MALYEERRGMGSREMFYLSSSQGRAPASPWLVAAVGDSHVDVGIDLYGFYYQVTEDWAGC